MASKVDICNQALANIGKAPIAALDNATEAARQCARFYDRALATTLRDFPWQFAKRQVGLALLPSTGDGWTYLYAYPAGCVKIRKVYASESYDDDETEFDLFNLSGTLTVACDIEDAKAEYTALVTDTTLFDASFEGALVYALASELAIPLSGDLKRRQMMLQLYTGALPMAQLATSTERRKPTAYTSSYSKGRW